MKHIKGKKRYRARHDLAIDYYGYGVLEVASLRTLREPP
jgi:hypothetical protein